MPASVAYATPCGSTTSALMRPAMRSARIVSRVTRWRHARKGKSLSASGDGETAGREIPITPSRRRTCRLPALNLAFPRDDGALDVAHQEIEQVSDAADHDDAHDHDVGAEEVRGVQHHLPEARGRGDHLGGYERRPAESDRDPHA